MEAYTAFLSYSTEPDYPLARELEAYIEAFHLRRGIKKLGLTKLEICRDGSDFKLPPKSASTAERTAILNILDRYLAESHYLAVLCSCNARNSKYVIHEIEYFLEHGFRDRILLLVTEGTDPSTTPEEVFPRAILDARLHENPWYDLRGKRARKNPAWRRVRDFDDELVRLAAHLHDDSAGRIYPAWERERERQMRRVRAFTVAALLGMALAGGWWGWSRTDAYQYEQLISEAPVRQVKQISEFAQVLAQSGYVDRGLAVARESSNPDSQFEALLSVAEVLLKASDIKEAGPIYLEALTVRRSWNPVDPNFAKCLAGAILTLGFVPEVDKILKRRDATLLRSTAQRVLAAGKPEVALRVARDISGNFMDSRSSTLVEIAGTLTAEAARPLLEEALREVQGNVNSSGREEVVQGFIRIGDFDRAWQIADRDKYGADDIFYSLALWAAERGDLSRARKALPRAGQYGHKHLIDYLADKNLTEYALELAS